MDYIKALVEDRDLMLLRLQTSLRLLQISSQDVLLSPAWFDMSFIQESTKYPWANKNALFRSLHAMMCRVDQSRDWTNHSVIKSNLQGDDGVAESTLGMSKTIAWLVSQCYSSNDDKSQTKRSRQSQSTIRTLQKKYFLVFLGVNLIYESEVHNLLLKKAEVVKVPVREIRSMKSTQKYNSVLHQLFNDRHKFRSANAKTIAGPSKAPASIGGNSGSTSTAQPSAKTPDTKVLAQTSRDISDLKKQLGDTPHSYGLRAWNRLDKLMFQSMKRFLTESGQFNMKIEWSSMTKHFHEEFEEKKLAGYFMLDMLTETHRPGLSIGLNGLVLDHVFIDTAKLMKMNAPATETFQSLLGPTEGPLLPVTDRGRNLYPEVTERTEEDEGDGDLGTEGGDDEEDVHASDGAGDD
ncbi:uncharacterized protein MELLADRAFT_88118 [Melampsora larici-populina 98AG31]|uniref:Uncharacterized protein n=1 Tax=Melampsora larici-populina (strain 98AG31 / pathotype 3-4-7) TaxID=747676 RepID=F4SE38_MELLP|nr:uncharacterized protein MELLADRAFT_88118 [Melampsora larici-populina 98AG31]EGF97089.1 hypothetical protein MELLADRAFT_88118 [Melampsora larici-populina 98AG31]